MLKKTKLVLDFLSKQELFEKHDIRFVGGTALSYLIKHRLSEDLDFAMLEIPGDEIDDLMQQVGAKKVPHSQLAIDAMINDGAYIEDLHIRYILDGVKIEFFVPPFNIEEESIWTSEAFSLYEKSKLKIASFQTIIYMKSMAFWNRKKYRDLFDIYYAINNLKDYDVKAFVSKYLEYNITYTLKDLYDKIQSTTDFYKKVDDEGLDTLVNNPKPYEWYRKQIEKAIHKLYLDELYS